MKALISSLIRSLFGTNSPRTLVMAVGDDLKLTPVTKPAPQQKTLRIFLQKYEKQGWQGRPCVIRPEYDQTI